MVTSKPIIFISHISEEANLAAILKAHVEADFIDTVTVYVSSDTESISAGENWLTSIDVALNKACIELILCSKASIKRGWINFEAGAGWMRHIPVVPVCHTRLLPEDLPMPSVFFKLSRQTKNVACNQFTALSQRSLNLECQLSIPK